MSRVDVSFFLGRNLDVSIDLVVVTCYHFYMINKVIAVSIDLVVVTCYHFYMINKVIAAYRIDGFSFSGSGETTLNGVLYTVLYFSSSAHKGCVVLVNEKEDMFQEFKETAFGGKISKNF